MMTRKAVVYAVIGMSAVLLALPARNFQLLVAGLLISGFLLVALFRRPTALTASRAPGGRRLFEGDTRQVAVQVENTASSSSGTLEVYDELSDRLKIGSGQNRAVCVLPPAGGLKLRYGVEAPLRGYHALGPLGVREEESLGFARWETELGGTERLEVLPHTENVEEFASRSRRVRPFPGPMLCRRPGPGMEFYRIRDYIKGDPLRNINWKLLAKRHRLMVNDYEKEALSDVIIIIDAREVGNCGTVSCNPLEYAVKGAASLARYFIFRRDKVGLVIYGRGVETIPPGAGGHHLDTLVAHLTAVEGAGATTFEEAMKLVQPYLAPGTALVFITPLEFDPTLTPKATELLVSGHPIIVLSPGPFQFETVAAGTADPKYRLLRLERQNFMDNLRFFGIEVVDWTPEMKVWELIERCENAR
jgi:uncharacterized protein (DUF58 family)